MAQTTWYIAKQSDVHFCTNADRGAGRKPKSRYRHPTASGGRGLPPSACKPAEAKHAWPGRGLDCCALSFKSLNVTRDEDEQAGDMTRL